MEIIEDKDGVFYAACGIIVRRAGSGDVKWLADYICQSDIDEAWAISHSTPESLLEDAFVNSSLCLTIEHEGNIVGMFGVLQSSDEKGTVWFIATDEIKNIGRVFLKHAKDFIAIMLTYAPVLENYVHSKNVKSIMWMRYAGAELKEAKPYGVEGELFHHFEFKRQELQIPGRQIILALEEKMMQHPEAMIGDCFPLKHSFAKGTYVREIAIPKGMVLVSKIHKHSHPVFVLSGDISIYTEDGVKRIKGPCSFISPAGAKRVGVTHEDTVWVTVHATEETDLEKIEEELIAKNFKELDEKEIQNFVTEALCHS